MLVQLEDRVHWHGLMTHGICGSPRIQLWLQNHRYYTFITNTSLVKNIWINKLFNKTKWATYGGHGNVASDIPQLMSSGSILGIGQKLDLNVPYFESNYSCLFVDFLLLNIKINIHIKYEKI